MFDISKHDTKKLNKKFTEARPYPHLVIENFLDEKDAQRLAKAIRKEEFKEKDSDLFHLWQTSDLAQTKNKDLKEMHSFVVSKEFADFMKDVSGLNVKPGVLDFAGSLYKDTNYLLCHDDKVEDRKIAYILYLSDDFKEKEGGALVIFDDDNGKPGKPVKKYSPKWNSLAMFAVSNKSWHSVDEVIGKKDRYAIGGWLK
ncbi:MAG TPA: 2OG-Fe(II) oxygenase family protein [Candidatus Nanoarchaeia archaeon]|nr:2OG-Fe(II) oxygenase family protein [Candidatus Nanoarchaeia archaeon]